MKFSNRTIIFSLSDSDQLKSLIWQFFENMPHKTFVCPKTFDYILLRMTSTSVSHFFLNCWNYLTIHLNTD